MTDSIEWTQDGGDFYVSDQHGELLYVVSAPPELQPKDDSDFSAAAAARLWFLAQPNPLSAFHDILRAHFDTSTVTMGHASRDYDGCTYVTFFVDGVRRCADVPTSEFRACAVTEWYY